MGHPHQGVVYRAVTVGMVFAQYLSHYAGALLVRRVGPRAHLLHGVEDASMHRLEAVTHVGQGPRDDDAHGVGQVGGPHFLFDADRLVILRRWRWSASHHMSPLITHVPDYAGPILARVD